MFHLYGFTFPVALKDRNAFTFSVKAQPVREKLFLFSFFENEENDITILLNV